MYYNKNVNIKSSKEEDIVITSNFTYRDVTDEHQLDIKKHGSSMYGSYLA